mgnify:CR=1 FL=1
MIFAWIWNTVRPSARRSGPHGLHGGLTQDQLAAKAQLAGCDLTRSALAKIECGQRSIYPDELKALHEALQIPYESLLQ